MSRFSKTNNGRQASAIRPKTTKPKRSATVNGKSVKQTGQILFDRFFHSQSLYFYELLGATVFLVIFGAVMVLSASSIDSLMATRNSFSVGFKQFGFAFMGLAFMAIVSLLPTSFVRSKAPLIIIPAFVLQASVFVIGKEINGNKNWIDIFGIFSFQPSELLKLAMIVYLASYLAKNQDLLDLKSVWYRAIFWSTCALLLVMLGRDLGTSIIMLVIFLGLMVLAGMPRALLNRVLLILVPLIAFALFSSPSRIGRITAWLNPDAPDPFDYNWQSEHGLWALAAGRIFGSGLGESKMKWSWIPEVENDFIFAVIGEELGLIGALLVIAVFVFMAITFTKILRRTRDAFSRFVVMAVMLWVIFQALVNIAVVLRLLPVLGVPLPLISAGGTSLISLLIAIGLVLAIERENHSATSAVTRTRSR